MWNGTAKKYHYDVENVLTCLAQQNVHDETMPTRGFTVGYNHLAEGSVFEQFTGRTDKNGTKIFEGDKMKHPTEGEFIVIWDKYWLSFAAKTEGSEAVDQIDRKYLEQCKIIGNIHES